MKPIAFKAITPIKFIKIAVCVSILPLTLIAEDSSVAMEENFFTGSSINGGLYLMGRNRDRLKTDGTDSTWVDNLTHISTLASLGLKSREYGDIFAYELAGFAVIDMYNGDPTVVNQENEFSFASDEWGNNYKAGNSSDYFTYENLEEYEMWSDSVDLYQSKLDSIANARGYTDAQKDSLAAFVATDNVSKNREYDPYNGVSLYRAVAHVTLPFGLTLQGGLGQFGVEGVLGNNWSYLPGSYTGGKADLEIGDKLTITYALVNSYKAPWFQKTVGFSKQNAWAPNAYDPENRIDYLQGGSVKFKVNDNHTITASVGNSEGYMMNYFGKYGVKAEVASGLDLSYQLYISDIYDDKFSKEYNGFAQYHAITAALNVNLWNIRVEATHTEAEGALGNYLPRLTRGYGNSQGGFQIWWDLRSDWNEDGETAIFANVSRKLDDLIGTPGWTLGAGGAYGFGAEYAPSNLTDGVEYAWKVDLSFTTDLGRFKGSTFVVHYMQYTNDQSELGDWTFPNMFSSEKDFMVKAILPFGMKL